MYSRKLVKAGPSSHTIALPKEWINTHKLKKGDIVYLHEFQSNQLLLTSSTTTQETALPKEKYIDVDGKKEDTIQREITSAYLNNYRLITLTGTTLQEKAKTIREMLHHFVALEITEQHKTKIVAKDFLDLNEISVDKTIKRIDMMIRTMFEDLSTAQQLELRDEDVNRLYFLLVRLLKSALTEQNIAKKLSLTPQEILNYWQLTHDLENLADHIKQANEIISTTQQHKNAKETITLYKTLQQMYVEAMTANYQKDKNTAEKIAQQRTQINQQINKISTRQTALSENASAISTHILNIARHVIDED
ncbi:hypothetical protein HY484_04730 [Candidatus Woesearchaeota archaeon]|nr:hypothetical protein [Candidatus Woesearchaeota archaeon]